MNGSSSSDMMAGLAGLLGAGVVAIILIVSIALALALTVFIIIVNWKLLEKAGEPGWKAIIPFYNLYTMCDISMTKPTSIVVFVIYMTYESLPISLASSEQLRHQASLLTQDKRTIYSGFHADHLWRTRSFFMAPHSSTLAWKTPWTEKPGRLQSMGSHRVRHD